MSEQALRVAQAAKSAVELQQYRQELHGEANDRVNVTHRKQPTLESVLSARYFAAATFCVCVLLAGWGHQALNVCGFKRSVWSQGPSMPTKKYSDMLPAASTH